MTIYEYWQMLPPEIITAIVTAIGGLILAIIAFIVWVFRQLPKTIESKLSLSHAEAQSKISEAEAKWKLEFLEVQNQLDQTQSNRELMRLQISEQEQNRTALLKIIEGMREDGQKRDKLHSEFLKETTESYKGIQANTAATLELLKTHQEHDEAMSIGQRKVIDQNDETHKQLEAADRKLNDVQSDLATVIRLLDTIASSHTGDRKILDAIQERISKVQDEIKHLEDIVLKPSVASETLPKLDDTIKLPEIEDTKELNPIDEKDKPNG